MCDKESRVDTAKPRPDVICSLSLLIPICSASSLPLPLPLFTYTHSPPRRSVMSNDASPATVAPRPATHSESPPQPQVPLRYQRYDGARENEYVPSMRQLISKDLSEPYSIYVYRYFLYQWGDLCFLAMNGDEMVGVVVSKLEPHHGGPLRGYIAMLAVREEFRGQGIATRLVRMAIDAMIERDADEVPPPSLHLRPGWSMCVCMRLTVD